MDRKAFGDPARERDTPSTTADVLDWLCCALFVASSLAAVGIFIWCLRTQLWAF